jgi:hypothetical protein
MGTRERPSKGWFPVPESLSPELRTLRAKLAAHTKWANTDDPAEATASARKAYFTRLAFKSARARQATAAARNRFTTPSGGEAA